MARASKSQFIDKLHQLLEHPLDPASLRWISDDAFEITCNDALARQALSPCFEFRSLSSFIRQLSYYNFKRLSDRRRSSERRSNNAGYIVFTHPSGVFNRGDGSKLHEIMRKTRKRPEKGSRRVSSASEPSAEDYEREPTPDMPGWPPSSSHFQQSMMYEGEDRTIRHYSSLPSFQPAHSMVRHYSHDEDYQGPWKSQGDHRWRPNERPGTSPIRAGGDAGPHESLPPIRHDLPPLAPMMSQQAAENENRRADYSHPSFAANRFNAREGNLPAGLTIPYTESSISPTYVPSLSNPFIPNGLAGPLPSPSPTSTNFTPSPLSRTVELANYSTAAPAPHSYPGGAGATSFGNAMLNQYSMEPRRDSRPYYRPSTYQQPQSDYSVPPTSFTNPPPPSANWNGQARAPPLSAPHALDETNAWSNRA